MTTGTHHRTAWTVLKRLSEIIAVLAMLGLTVWLFPAFLRLRDAGTRDTVREYILGKGFVGILMLLGVQILQVVLAVIPGEPVEVLFGFIYGPYLGLVLCLCGMILGALLIFLVTRALGKHFMEKIEQSGKYDKLKFLKEPTRRDILIFLLFFIPGTPKDTLTYFAPFTKIACGRFLLLSTIARIPSVITSTIAGDSIYSGNFIGSLVIFAVTGGIGIAGILIYNKILSRHNEKKRNESNATERGENTDEN